MNKEISDEIAMICAGADVAVLDEINAALAPTDGLELIAAQSADRKSVRLVKLPYTIRMVADPAHR